jgi:hypothetical protein
VFPAVDTVVDVVVEAFGTPSDVGVVAELCE